jgi:hypothetical protein
MEGNAGAKEAYAFDFFSTGLQPNGLLREAQTYFHREIKS